MTGELILRLALAAGLGTLLGMERAYRAKTAGTRTHCLVALGSALFMIVSQYGFLDAPAGVRAADPARVAAQIVSGIGFLGAGTIIMQKHVIHGLTTAAGMWVAAGIGMASAAGRRPRSALSALSCSAASTGSSAAAARRSPKTPDKTFSFSACLFAAFSVS